MEEVFINHRRRYVEMQGLKSRISGKNRSNRPLMSGYHATKKETLCSGI
jgi:hypothetical protein